MSNMGKGAGYYLTRSKSLLIDTAIVAILAIFMSFAMHLALPGLGEKEQGEVWNETLGVYEYVQGDNSLLILLYGIAVLFICAAFICVWAGAVKSAYQAQVCIEKNKPVTTFAEDIKSLFDKNLHKLLLTLPVGGILIFTILPLIFMIAMAFTN